MYLKEFRKGIFIAMLSLLSLNSMGQKEQTKWNFDGSGETIQSHGWYSGSQITALTKNHKWNWKGSKRSLYFANEINDNWRNKAVGTDKIQLITGQYDAVFNNFIFSTKARFWYYDRAVGDKLYMVVTFFLKNGTMIKKTKEIKPNMKKNGKWKTLKFKINTDDFSNKITAYAITFMSILGEWKSHKNVLLDDVKISYNRYTILQKRLITDDEKQDEVEKNDAEKTLSDFNADVTSKEMISSNTVLYPNPVISSLSIRFTNDINVDKISIFSSLGQQIHTESVNALNTISVDVASYPVGFYFLKVSDVNGTTVSKSFVVSK